GLQYLPLSLVDKLRWPKPLQLFMDAVEPSGGRACPVALLWWMQGALSQRKAARLSFAPHLPARYATKNRFQPLVLRDGPGKQAYGLDRHTNRHLRDKWQGRIQAMARPLLSQRGGSCRMPRCSG